MACTQCEAPSVAGSAQSPLAKVQCNQPAWISCPDWSFIFMHFYLYKTLNPVVFEYYIFQINILLYRISCVLHTVVWKLKYYYSIFNLYLAPQDCTFIYSFTSPVNRLGSHRLLLLLCFNLICMLFRTFFNLTCIIFRS